MVGPGSQNVIEYVFQGDTLGLEQAVTKVRNMLTATVKSLKELQGGKLTPEQTAQIKHARKLASEMAATSRKKQALTNEESRHTRAAGKYALTEAQRLAKEVTRIKQRQAKEVQKAQEKAEADEAACAEQVRELTSIAGQERAKQRATYLEEYADKFKQVLSQEAYDEIKNAVAAFRAATTAPAQLSAEQVAALSPEDQARYNDAILQQAEYTEALNQTWANYSETLQAINRSQQQAAKGILSVADFFKEAKRQILATIKTFSFWMQMIRKVMQITGQYQQMLEDLRYSGQLNNPALAGIKETADAWRSLSRQISMFMTNIGGLVSTVLAPVAKILSTALMIVNAIIGTIAGTNTLAENARSGAGLTKLDEINTQKEQPEDQLKKMTRGWQDMKNAIQPIIDLIKSLWDVISIVLVPFQVLWAIIKSIGDILKPIFDGILIGLNQIVSGIAWLLNWVKLAFEWFTDLLGVTAEWTAEGTTLNTVLKWIGIVLSGLVAIALAKWIVAAAVGFATLAKNIALATAKLVVYIAQTIVSIAKTIAHTLATWWENAALIAKIGLLTLGAGLVIVPIVLAASGTMSSQADRVPMMAAGGVVSQPTITMIGEGRYSEAVVPLGNSSQFTAMKEEIADNTSRKLSQTPIYQNGQPMRAGANIPIVLQINGREFARAIIPDLGTVQPQTGVKIQR